MNIYIANKWIAALESGEYKQGKGSLCQIDESGEEAFCCLGVLSELARKEGVVKRKIADGSQEYSYFGPSGSAFNVLPQDVLDWSGMDTAGGMRSTYLDGPEQLPSLWVLNDHHNADFKQIAEVIREEWKDL